MKTFLKILLFFVWVAIYSIYIRDIDTTDYSKTRRSGLSLYTDYGTGYQYIRAGFFGTLIPRKGFNSEHMNINGIKHD